MKKSVDIILNQIVGKNATIYLQIELVPHSSCHYKKVKKKHGFFSILSQRKNLL